LKKLGVIMFLISTEDNVATLLRQGEEGEERAIVGASERIRFSEAVPLCHKVARSPILKGEPVVKYGVPIGRATRDIAVGNWVHLHNMESFADEKSSTLDIHSGTDSARRYE
jgi:altronate dehydratase